MRPNRPASRASTAASISTRQTKTAKHWDGKWARRCMRRRRNCGAASWRRQKHWGLALAACHRPWAAASVTPQSLHPPRSHTGTGSKCQSPYASACGFGHGGLALRACPCRWTAASVAPTIFVSAAVPHRDRQQVPVPVCICRLLRKWGAGLPAGLSPSLDRGFSCANDLCIRRGPTPGQAASASPRMHLPAASEMEGLALRACPRRWTAASVAPTIFAFAAVPNQDRHLRRQSPACNCQRTYEMGGWPCGPVAVVGPRLQSRQRSLHPPRSHTGTGSKCQSPYASAGCFGNGGLALRACHRRWTAASVTPTIFASAAVPHRDRQQVPVPVCICQRLRKWGTGPAGLSPSLDRGFSHANDLCIRRGPTPGQATSASPRMHLPAASEMGGWPCGPVTVVGPRLQSRQRSLHPPRSHTGTGSKCQSPYASAGGFGNGGLAFLRACHRRWTAASVAPTIFAFAAVPHRDRHLRRRSPACIRQ